MSGKRRTSNKHLADSTDPPELVSPKGPWARAEDRKESTSVRVSQALGTTQTGKLVKI